MPVHRRVIASKEKLLKSFEPSPSGQKKDKPVNIEPTSIALHSVSASIVVDGKDMPCYATEVNSLTRTVTCFVESQEGKSYCIKLQRNPTQGQTETDLQARVYIDNCQRPVTNALVPRKGTYFVKGPPISPYQFQPFQFSSIETTADDSVIATSSSTTDVGSVVVEVTKVILGEISPLRVEVRKTNRMVVHETTKLAGAHITSLGPVTVKPEESRLMKITVIQTPDNNPYLKFVFRYRSRGILLANEIIPRDKPAPQLDSHTSGSSGKLERETIEVESDDELELLEVQAEEAAAKAQVAAAHAAVLVAKVKKATLLRERAKRKQGTERPYAVKNEDQAIDLTHL